MAAVQISIAILAIVVGLREANGHGMMLDPPNRSSLWRYDSTAPVNYNDNENFCGGFGVQWQENGGKCGVCGDNYKSRIPRPNENTGYYGEGKVVATYKSGSVIDVSVNLTTNHKGWFTYSVCNLINPSKPEMDNCFKSIRFADGSTSFTVNSGISHFVNKIRLPSGLRCKRCVLRWHYKTGNSWGICTDGSGGMGCGPQEVFRSCSDIAIV